VYLEAGADSVVLFPETSTVSAITVAVCVKLPTMNFGDDKSDEAS
jgi:hypothetical protein